MFSYIRGRHVGVCHCRGIHMPPYGYTPVHLYAPCTSVCPIHPVHQYVLSIPYVPHMSWKLWGHLYTPYVGVFWRHQYICQAFLCLSVHPFASQFITVIPVASHDCGLLLYWTGCLWMSGTLHAVVPFFVVSFISQASATMAMTTTPLVTCVFWYTISSLNGYHGPLLDGASSNIRPAWCGFATNADTKALWRCCWPLCHCAAVATSISDASYGFCQLCNESSTGRYSFRVEPPTICFFICLECVLVYAFYFQMPCWVPCSPTGAQLWLLPPLLWVGLSILLLNQLSQAIPTIW